MSGRIWTISNILSLLRLGLAAPIITLLLRNDPSDRPLVAALIVAAAASDFFDGLVARRLHQVTDLGKIIDPVADKVAIGGAAIALAILGRIPVWFLVAALLRDIVILSGGVYVRKTRGVVLQSNVTGKWTAVALAAYLLMAALVPQGGGGVPETALLAVSCVLMAASSMLYARRLITVLGRS
jgi:CDP-diacylglycerol--glycerol-3-phosphate 3-phosphatidyltransferase